MRQPQEQQLNTLSGTDERGQSISDTVTKET